MLRYSILLIGVDVEVFNCDWPLLQIISIAHEWYRKKKFLWKCKCLLDCFLAGLLRLRRCLGRVSGKFSLRNWSISVDLPPRVRKAIRCGGGLIPPILYSSTTNDWRTAVKLCCNFQRAKSMIENFPLFRSQINFDIGFECEYYSCWMTSIPLKI